MPRQLLRPKVAQRRLGIGHDQFYRLIREGKLRLVRLGPRTTGVIEDELDEFISGLPESERPTVLA
jgi:excisionase family DNA binding protein